MLYDNEDCSGEGTNIGLNDSGCDGFDEDDCTEVILNFHRQE